MSKKRRTLYSQNHQERFGVEKNGKNTSGAELFGEIAPLDVLRRSQDDQMELYQTGNLRLVELFFIEGGCFLQKVQRQMTLDNNLEMLTLFLRYWEFIPTERSFMIKNASLEFIDRYLSVKKLGKQSEELARNGRFKNSFIAGHIDRLNGKAKEICRGFRKMDV